MELNRDILIQDEYENEQKKAENEKLSKMVDSLSDSEREKIYQQGNVCPSLCLSLLIYSIFIIICHIIFIGLQLQSDQNRSEDNNCLPTVTVSDVEKQIRPTEVQIEYQGLSLKVFKLKCVV